MQAFHVLVLPSRWATCSFATLTLWWCDIAEIFTFIFKINCETVVLTNAAPLEIKHHKLFDISCTTISVSLATISHSIRSRWFEFHHFWSKTEDNKYDFVWISEDIAKLMFACVQKYVYLINRSSAVFV